MVHQLPPGAFRNDLSATYNQHTVPRELRRPSRLPPETWGLVVVAQGEVALHSGAGAPQTVDSRMDAVIPPQTDFHIADTGKPALFHIEYFHEPRAVDAQGLAAQLGGRS